MDTQPQTPAPSRPPMLPQDHARATVALSMTFTGKMNDEFLPPDQFKIFCEHLFPEWPKELQDKLRPFGAEMIRDPAPN